jgi:RNA polymerase sigma-70 factor (ECF subfamily)
MDQSGSASETEQLLERVAQGDERALEQLLAEHRPYLRRLIELRMEDDLHARLDPSDVVQETQLVAIRRIDDFLARRPTSFRLWLRSKALEKLIELRRHHQAKRRSVKRDVALSSVSSFAVAKHLRFSRPSSVVQRQELTEAAHQALESMSEMDREVLILRHGEALSNAEVAEVLNIEPDAASKRYGRAVRKLCERLHEMGIPLDG